MLQKSQKKGYERRVYIIAVFIGMTMSLTAYTKEQRSIWSKDFYGVAKEPRMFGYLKKRIQVNTDLLIKDLFTNMETSFCPEEICHAVIHKTE